MTELIPLRQVHFQHPDVEAVALGWAMQLNEDTGVVEIAWSPSSGSLVTSYVPLVNLVPSALTSAFFDAVTERQVLRRAS